MPIDRHTESLAGRVSQFVVDRFIPTDGWRVTRMAAAVVLLTGAAAKMHQYWSEPSPHDTLLSSKWFLIGLVEIELLGSCILFAGILVKWAWVGSLTAFSAFALVSFSKWLAGEGSCGCFGRWQVNPLLTAAFDAGLVVALLRWRPNGCFAADFHSVSKRATCVLLIWVAVGLPVGWAMSSYAEASLSEAGEIIGNGKIVVLKPETWVGKQFPLFGHIDIGSKLTTGLWLVLLHRHDCSACREAALQYESLAKEFYGKSNCPSIALIECPPYAPNAKGASSGLPLVAGHLDDGHNWQLSGPTSVLIDAGQVRSVFTNARDVELLQTIWGGRGS